MEIRGRIGLSDDLGEHRMMLSYPHLDFVFGSVTLREDIRQPDGQRPPTASARMRFIIANLSIIPCGTLHLHHQTKEQGDIINTNREELGLCVHPLNVTPRMQFVPVSSPGNDRHH